MSDIRKEAQRITEKLKSKGKVSEGTEVQLLTDIEGSLVADPVFTSTQHVLLDIVLGGGIPSSRIVELYSANEGAGKSTLCAHIIAEAQRRHGLAVLIDSEHGSISSRLRQLGVDIEALVYVDPECIEDVLTLIEEVIAEVDDAQVADRTMIVWDSLAATPTRSQMSGSYDDPIQIGEVARIMSHNLRRMSRVLARSKASLIMVNQGREKIGVMYGEKTTTGGGKGLKFHAGMRIRMDQVSKIKDADGNIIGIMSEVYASKNRLANPFVKVRVPILFSSGVDVMMGLFQALEHVGIVKKSGAWYSMEGVDKKFRMNDLPKVLSGVDQEPVVEALVKAGANEEFVRYILESMPQ